MNFRCARLKICFYSKTDFELSLPNHILQVNKIFYGSVTWCPHQGLLFHLLFQENRLCPNPMDVESLSSLPHILRSWSSMKVAPSELTLAHLFLLYTVRICWVSSTFLLQGIITMPTLFCKAWNNYKMFVTFNRLLLVEGKRFIEQNVKQLNLDQTLYSYRSSIFYIMGGYS